jgi:hypothetical protein
MGIAFISLEIMMDNSSAASPLLFHRQMFEEAYDMAQTKDRKTLYCTDMFGGLYVMGTE